MCSAHYVWTQRVYSSSFFSYISYIWATVLDELSVATWGGGIWNLIFWFVGFRSWRCLSFWLLPSGVATAAYRSHAWFGWGLSTGWTPPDPAWVMGESGIEPPTQRIGGQPALASEPQSPVATFAKLCSAQLFYGNNWAFSPKPMGLGAMCHKGGYGFCRVLRKGLIHRWFLVLSHNHLQQAQIGCSVSPFY